MREKWQIESYKACNDRKILQENMRHIEQQSNGCETRTETAVINLTTFKKPASLLQVYKTLQDIHTNVHASHCDNLDCILSHLNSVHVHYFEET